jgi:hypothetical protein
MNPRIVIFHRKKRNINLTAAAEAAAASINVISHDLKVFR